MKPIKVEFQAFGPYVGYEVVDFVKIASNGLFLICGKTGSGKTTILDAMTFSLFGKSSGHGRDVFRNMRCMNADKDMNTYVKFEFENNGEFYIFERRLTPKGKDFSTACNVMRKENGTWTVLFENAKEADVNKKANEILGLDFEQFRQVIVLPQGQFEKLLTSSSEEKEEILKSIFGEDKWGKYASKLYEEADNRKAELKAVKDKIMHGLQEEQCETMEDLHALIDNKKLALEQVETDIRSAQYAKVRQEQQELLALSKRFDDLKKANKRLTDLENVKETKNNWEEQLKNAQRANKLKNVLSDVDACKNSFMKRQAEESKSIEAAKQADKDMEVARGAWKKHVDTAQDFEKKKVLVIQYGEKRSDYENIEAVQQSYDAKRKLEMDAKKEEEKAAQELKKLENKIVETQKEYDLLNSERDCMTKAYIAGIAGDLAKNLVDGEACPVCGNKEHPKKAVLADNSITMAQVDAKGKEAENKRVELVDIMKQQEDASRIFEQKKANTEKAHEECLSEDAKLTNMKKNLVEGIENLAALEKVISQLNSDIEQYDETKSNLENALKIAELQKTEAKTKIETAKKETEDTKQKLEEAEHVLEQALNENDFSSVEEVKALLLSDEKLEQLQKSIADYDANLATAKETVQSISDELTGKQEPDENKVRNKLDEIAEAEKECSKQQGILKAEIERLIKKEQDLNTEGQGIDEKVRQAEEDFSFAKKLRGDSGTGLQRYVLGIMFSSVISAANKMLEKVHDGRYQLNRSDDKAQGKNKRGLELKVRDSHNKEEGERFVGTLSGGEKFLTSLALSIGMSTVAQKKGMKIEALFIDEGFGTLDEESIDDAMEILNSIQEANGLVGIISHVKLLQDQISTKLCIEKQEKGSHIIHTIG